MKSFRYVLIVIISTISNANVCAQDSKFLAHLVDSLPKGKPILVNFQIKKGFMATERIAISKNGKQIYYGVRNGYGTLGKHDAKAHIMKINYTEGAWGAPQKVFADSAGAPAFSKNEKTLYFQYDDTLLVKGLYTNKTKLGWQTPKQFNPSIRKSHYFQSPKKNSYYYTAGINKAESVQDVFQVITSKKDTIINRLGFNIKGEWADFYMSPNEDFLILLFGKENKGGNYKFYGNSNLFISFKRKNNTWTKPLNLGKEVHSISKWNWGPYVTRDKEYLFFSSWGKTVGTYMIDFKPIYNKLKIEALKE
ncbi:hypothetical protein [Seonamhaeicola marinus]|uniref:Exo-alpha-sialidase n=1 Tax=Seonamhaeicola marinus TaxID=1912246 RepID=A0A5D0IWP9_9FLAO|nr:hypothetical protein [Seonamhaeicola marinus]TYA86777.1 hypothetical protein FUA24_04425 [Seonamhaeicola marinus]